MIIRIGATPPSVSVRYRLALFLRRLANRIDGAAVVVLATDNVALKAEIAHACTMLAVRQRAVDFQEEHAAEIAELEMRQALHSWQPESGVRQ